MNDRNQSFISNKSTTRPFAPVGAFKTRRRQGLPAVEKVTEYTTSCTLQNPWKPRLAVQPLMRACMAIKDALTLVSSIEKELDDTPHALACWTWPG